MLSEERRKANVETRILAILKELGVSCKNSGGKHLKEAIQMVYEEPEAIYQFTEQICEPIAKKYGILAGRVQRRMSSEVERMWGKGNFEAFEKYFGKTFSKWDKPPYNKEVIANIAEYLHMQDQPEELTTRISKILIEIGIFPSAKGFKWLR